MASPVLDVTLYTPSEQRDLLTAAKAEYLKRMTGRVTQGSSAAQSYGMTTMSVDDLIRLMNGLGQALGITDDTVSATPNFNTRRGAVQSGYPVTL